MTAPLNYTMSRSCELDFNFFGTGMYFYYDSCSTRLPQLRNRPLNVWHDNDQRPDQLRRQDVRRKVLVIYERVIVMPQFGLNSGRSGLHLTERHRRVKSYVRQDPAPLAACRVEH